MKKNSIKIAIIGLGYVGIPLLKSFSKYYQVIGIDNNFEKILYLRKKNLLKKIRLSSDIKSARNCNVFIITVPTPIFKNKKPNLRSIKKACEEISRVLKKNDIIILESTVYPGLTENYCAPLIQKNSNLLYNKDFFMGYSPERINPGDNKHNLENIIKLTSGSNKKTAKFVDDLYKKIIKVGTYKVNSIKEAEAAKVIENSQRDLNIAFMNELTIIFNKLNINVNKVLDAAATKWNFLNFKPGLVGGHCIGVDPYYLTHISKINNYNPKVISSGRDINDKMPNYIYSKLIKKINSQKKSIKKMNFLILGATFKENSDDLRNSKIFDIINKLKNRAKNIEIFEPNISKSFWLKKYKFINKPKTAYYDCIIVSVGHSYFKNLGFNKIKKFGKNENTIIYDIKNIFPSNMSILKI